MEVIPQKVYTYNDGVPAYKSGEWNGIRPSRWKGSKLILKPIPKVQESFERCSRHFPQKLSSEFVFRPHMKLVPPYEHIDTFKPSRRDIEPLYTEIPTRNRNIAMHPPDQINLYTDDTRLFRNKQHIKIVEDKKETNVENAMSKKMRIFSFDQQRNGIDMHKPGDKLYRCVEYSPDFFKLEGIVPGSTNSEKVRKTSPKKDDNFFDTLDLNVKSLNPEKLWTSKVIKETMETEKNYVEKLDEWDKRIFGEKEKKEKKDK